MTKKNEVALTEEYAVAARPDWMKEDTGRGNEEVNSNDITLPRLSVIQDLSPQHKANKEEYIEGAKVGQLFNTVTKELYDKVAFIPVKLVKEWVLWKDRKKGGGFGGAFPDERSANRAKMEQDSPNDWEVVDTDVQYGLTVTGPRDNPVMEEVVISLSKGLKKASRNFNTMIKLGGGDRFSRIYSLESVDDTSKNGEDYKNLKFSQLGFVTEAMYKRAESVYEAIEAGLRSVAHDEDASTEKVVMGTKQEDTIDDEF